MKAFSTLVATGEHGNGVLGEGRDGFGYGAGTIVRSHVTAKAGTEHHGLVVLLGIGTGKGQILFYQLIRFFIRVGIGFG